MGGNCKCVHHVCAKVMVVLIWLSAFGFWWATAFKESFLWMNGEHFFRDVVILGLLLLTAKYCGCCGMGNCNHDESCKCGDCGMCK